mgnify:FL=1
MSNPLTTFIFEGASIRVFGDSVSPLFVAADICNALNLTNPSMAIASLAPFERAKLNLGAGKPDVNVVNESGLYTLILRSRDAVKEHCRVLFVVHNRLHYVDLRILPQKKALLTKYTIEFLGAGEQLNNPNFDKFGASFLIQSFS